MPDEVTKPATEVQPTETVEPTPEAVKPAEDLGGFKSQESKDAVLADLAEAREKLKKFEEAQAEAEKAKVSDIERAQTEANEAREEAEKARAEVALYRIAAKHGISSEEDLELLSSVSDEAAMEKLASRIAASAAPGTPKPDPSGGAHGSEPKTAAERAAAAEQAGDKSQSSIAKAQMLGDLARKIS